MSAGLLGTLLAVRPWSKSRAGLMWNDSRWQAFFPQEKAYIRIFGYIKATLLLL
jgi:hypothetical protein